MGKRFNFKVAAAALSLLIHMGVLGGLTVQSSRGASSMPAAQVMQASLLATGSPDSPASFAEDTGKADMPVETEHAEPMPAHAAEASTAGKETSPESAEANAASSPSVPLSSEWIPQLSKTPFPLLDDLPLVGSPAYYPTGELDVRPMPEVPIIVPFPDATLHKEKAVAILVLFIGADGTVERVEIDESDLPAEFERTAIDTFMQAKMRPGIKGGKAVPVRMKIEVAFESK